MTRFAPLGLHRCRMIMAAVVGSWLMADVRPALAQPDASPLPSFDFRQAGAVAGWGEPHDVSHIEATRQGMAVHIDGPDPYIFGPAREYPAGTPLLLKVQEGKPVAVEVEIDHRIVHEGMASSRI